MTDFNYSLISGCRPLLLKPTTISHLIFLLLTPSDVTTAAAYLPASLHYRILNPFFRSINLFSYNTCCFVVAECLGPQCKTLQCNLATMDPSPAYWGAGVDAAIKLESNMQEMLKFLTKISTSAALSNFLPFCQRTYLSSTPFLKKVTGMTALYDVFQQVLNDEIKEELATHDAPKNLAKMEKLPTRTNLRLHERRLEKSQTTNLRFWTMPCSHRITPFSVTPLSSTDSVEPMQIGQNRLTSPKGD
ncbi:hypothetical protein GOODEAATRI_002800 [Goodea atripinnis]|uniref:Uncharacterized protein n=1 Tax=Goodea atripinnis TaxID=208336 RepID=A0ABV0PAZ8_9TELE